MKLRDSLKDTRGVGEANMIHLHRLLWFSRNFALPAYRQRPPFKRMPMFTPADVLCRRPASGVPW
jgi:hypothetical protein